jgi:hypothetical protein
MFVAVASGAGRLVATTLGGGILTSSDGIDWQFVAWSDPYTLRGLAHGNGLWVAVGQSGLIVISTDAINWTFLDGAVDARYSLRAITFGAGRFVAVGGTHLGYAFSSVDGISWSVTELPKLSFIPAGVVFGNGRFVAAGGEGMVDVSTDGVNWMRATPSGARWNAQSVSYAQGHFLVVVQDGVLSSRDGTKWIRDFLQSPPTGGIQGIAYNTGNYVTVGLGGFLLRADGSAPYLDRIENGSGSIRISFSGGTERRYGIEAASDLSGPTWNRIAEVAAADGVGSFLDATGAPSSQRFYRIAPAQSASPPPWSRPSP